MTPCPKCGSTEAWCLSSTGRPTRTHVARTHGPKRRGRPPKRAEDLPVPITIYPTREELERIDTDRSAASRSDYLLTRAGIRQSTKTA